MEGMAIKPRKQQRRSFVWFCLRGLLPKGRRVSARIPPASDHFCINFDYLRRKGGMAQTIIRTTKGSRDPQVKKLLASGWRITSTHSQSQGYNANKTCCLGCLFLPLALLGKKKDLVEYVLEKED